MPETRLLNSMRRAFSSFHRYPREIVLSMTQATLDKFIKSRGWSIGADAGIAVVSKGRAGDCESNTLNKPILVFTFDEKGLIADISLEESKINQIVKREFDSIPHRGAALDSELRGVTMRTSHGDDSSTDDAVLPTIIRCQRPCSEAPMTITSA
jgi:Las17-binding protein actin regulator